MSQVLHKFEERLADLFGERRMARRHKMACEVRLPVGVSMPNERIDPAAERYPQPIMGRTRDVSEAGLSLVLPSLSLGDERIDAPGYPLRIVLCLPGGIVIVHAETVRCAALVDERGRDCYLVGAHIKRMSDADRRRFDKFLRTLN